MRDSVLIIAEAGVNHNGRLDLALKLVDAASDAGADFVKFQTFKADRQVSQITKKTRYQIKATGEDESHLEMLKRLELTPDMHILIKDRCIEKRIEFISTPFDIESVDFLTELGQNLIKIPSGEITNLPYLRHIAKKNKKILLSTGMCNFGEIEAARVVVEGGGVSKERITLLHCTSEYPAPMNEINLRAIQSLKVAFNINVGYSDHTCGIEAPIAAIAMGARVIEKHFTLDKKLPGPDHSASLDTKELKEMIRAIRNIEVALGDGVKRVSASELENRGVIRKSIVASKQIYAGDRITELNIAVKRPGTGLSPMLWDQVIGSVAKRDFAHDEQIEL